MLPSVTLCGSLSTPYSPSYVPSFWLRYADVMSFAERLYNAAMAAAETLLISEDEEQAMMDAVYTYPGYEDAPRLDALRHATSLSLINSHYSVSYARPYPPNVVSVAGMHMARKSSENVDRVSRRREWKTAGHTAGVSCRSLVDENRSARSPVEERSARRDDCTGGVDVR